MGPTIPAEPLRVLIRDVNSGVTRGGEHYQKLLEIVSGWAEREFGFSAPISYPPHLGKTGNQWFSEWADNGRGFALWVTYYTNKWREVTVECALRVHGHSPKWYTCTVDMADGG